MLFLEQHAGTTTTKELKNQQLNGMKTATHSQTSLSLKVYNFLQLFNLHLQHKIITTLYYSTYE